MMRALQSTELPALYPGSAITGNSQVLNVSTDTRTLQPGDAYVALRGPNFDGHEFNELAHDHGASLLVVDHPDTQSVPQWIVPDTRIALGKLAAANRRLSTAPVVALTGSSGKTSTKEMLSTLLGACGKTLATLGNLNNDIGVPQTLLRLAPEHEYAVIELGANHVGEIAYTARLAEPDVALLLNAGSAHLAEFGSLQRIRAAKGEILQGLNAGGVAVLNRDDPGFAEWAAMVPGRLVTFSINEHPDADVQAQIVTAEATRTLVNLHLPEGQHALTLPMAGAHNVANLAAAAAAMVALNLPDHLWIHAVKQLRSAPGRLTQTRIGKWWLIDDSYNANPESVRAAIDVLATSGAPQTLILGEFGELGEHTAEAHRAVGTYARGRISALWSIGPQAEPSSEAFGENGQHFVDKAAVIAALPDWVAGSTPGSVLVKGSRAAGMEDVMVALTDEIKKGASS